MNRIATEHPDVFIIQPDVYNDDRGQFFESYHKDKYKELGIKDNFVQTNVSISAQFTVRGLHYQYPHGQGKLVSVLKGKVFDVAVDIRKRSPDFGKWVGVILDDCSKRQLWIPPGFAHGFMALEDETIFSYQCTARYNKRTEHAINFRDPDIGILWPNEGNVHEVSEKDASAPMLKDISVHCLPR